MTIILASLGTRELIGCTRKKFLHDVTSIPVVIKWSLTDLTIPTRAPGYRLLNKWRSESSHYPLVQPLTLNRYPPSVRSSGSSLQMDPKLSKDSLRRSEALLCAISV